MVVMDHCYSSLHRILDSPSRLATYRFSGHYTSSMMAHATIQLLAPILQACGTVEDIMLS